MSNTVKFNALKNEGEEDLIIRGVGTPYLNIKNKAECKVYYSSVGSQEVSEAVAFAKDVPAIRPGMIFRSGMAVAWDDEEMKIFCDSRKLEFIDFRPLSDYIDCCDTDLGREYCCVYDFDGEMIVIPCMAVAYPFFFAGSRVVSAIMQEGGLSSALGAHRDRSGR
jgi:hypothetical protein